MTKLLQLRVVVAVDDDVSLADIKPHLRKIIAAAGTQDVKDGEDCRVHWATADVLQGPERQPNRKARGSPRLVETEQKDLMA